MRYSLRILVTLGAVSLFSAYLNAQATTGSIALSARITPTGAPPDPVRQFTFFILSKSYADVVKEVEGQNVLPTRDLFIDKLTCSPELKAWLKAHELLDLTSTDLDKLLTTDDIMKVPEFFDAYQRSNSGGVTKGLPQPKYRESERQSNPDKYQKLREEYLSATRKFIDGNPYTVQGIELELNAVNPGAAWDRLHIEHKRWVAQTAPDTAQLKYLAAKTETDLDGRALVTGLPPGSYWVSTLGMDASSGDRRLVWDVPVTVQSGQTAHLELSNLNAVVARKSTSP